MVPFHIRVGEPSYSIKYIEHFYSAARSGDVKTAGASIVYYEQWKATRDAALLQAIEDYNKDDVVSTFELREWLMRIRPAGAEVNGSVAGTSAQTDTAVQRPKSAAALKAEAAMELYREKLIGGLSDDVMSWTDEDRTKELMYQLLGFHRRTEKPVWWALFARQDATEEELLDDVEVIACMTATKPAVSSGDGWECEYTFPEQEFKLKTGDNCTVVSTLAELTDVVIDEDRRKVTFYCESELAPDSHNMAIGTGLPINVGVIQGAYKRFVDAYLAGDAKFQAGLDLLNRAVPRVNGHLPGKAFIGGEEDTLAGASRVVSNLVESCLFIQGPPGAGKTYTGSHVIVDILKSGKTVAVTSNSHKAINNLLSAVEKVAERSGFVFKGAKKSSSPESAIKGKFIADIWDTQQLVKSVSQYFLVAGTAWLLTSAKLEQKFDYLFVDEAGQVSLANLLAMSTCAKNIVLLGDQMQLGQPIQGVHPGESGKSTLDYLLKGEATIAPELGIFLKDTWRMHPDVCQFISKIEIHFETVTMRTIDMTRLQRHHVHTEEAILSCNVSQTGQFADLPMPEHVVWATKNWCFHHDSESLNARVLRSTLESTICSCRQQRFGNDYWNCCRQGTGRPPVLTVVVSTRRTLVRELLSEAAVADCRFGSVHMEQTSHIISRPGEASVNANGAERSIFETGPQPQCLRSAVEIGGGCRCVK